MSSVGFLLKAKILEMLTTPGDVVKLMKSDLKNNANKTNVKFVAVRNFAVGGKLISLFIVTDAPASFDALLKKQPKALKSKGVCDLVKSGPKVQVVVKQAAGQLGVDVIAKTLPLVVAKDTNFAGLTLAAWKAQQAAQTPPE